MSLKQLILFHFFLFLIIILSLSFFFSAKTVYATNEEGVTIEIEGQSPILNDDKVQAEQMAIVDASRKAVEKVVGTLVASETNVKDFQLLQDTIKTRANGYVSDQEVLRRWEDNGYYKVLVRLTIKKADLQQSVDAYKLTLLKAGKPRLMIFIPDFGLVTKVAQYMKDAGFPVIEPERIRDLQKSGLESNISTGDQEILAKLAVSFHAEILIIGNCRQEAIGETQGIFAVQAYLSIRAIRADSGQNLVSQTFSARGVDLNNNLAFQKALNSATDQAVAFLKEQLGKELINSKQSLQIIINGIQYSDLQQLQRRLKATPNVENVFLRNFSNLSAELDIDTGLLADQLADLISSWKELKLEVTNLSASKIVLRH